MFSLESQIEPYTDENFSAEVEAQHFFKSYGEADITKKLNEMSTIQQSIEMVLRQKVRSNYGMFLLANEEINQVDEEMLDLKHLITNTQKLMDDVQSNRLAESKAMRTNSFFGHVGEEEKPEESDGSAMSRAINDAKNSVPAWLVKAPEELAQFIVEQQYAKAVVIVLKTRGYVNTISQELHQALNRTAAAPAANKNIRNTAAASQAVEIAAAAAQAQTQALVGVLNRVDELCAHLSFTIRKSVLNLPTSSLWGKAEQVKLLKLLIALEEFDMAAEGFAISKMSNMKRALHSVESTGDTVAFAAELSTSFFTTLQEACQSFRTLFEEHFEKVEILNLLLVWVQQQVNVYVEILVPAMHTGITDLSNTVLNQLRKACAAAAASGGGGAGGAGGSSALLSRDSHDGGLDLDSIYGGDSGPSIGSLMEELAGKSPLSMLAGCLDEAFRAAHSIDSAQLQGSSCLGWTLMPEVQQVVSAYAERFLDQVGAQVRQDSWRPVVLQDLSVRSPAKNSAHLDYIESALEEAGNEESCEDPSQHPVCRSYEWLVAVLTHLSDELWALLKAEPEEESFETKSSDKKANFSDTAAEGASACYSRADICEVEPVAVGCLIRIFLRYVVEVESLNTKGFTKVQTSCYLKTLEAILSHLLPSLQRVISTCFFAEGVNNLHASPSYVFRTLKPRLTRLIKDKQTD